MIYQNVYLHKTQLLAAKNIFSKTTQILFRHTSGCGQPQNYQNPSLEPLTRLKHSVTLSFPFGVIFSIIVKAVMLQMLQNKILKKMKIFADG